MNCPRRPEMLLHSAIFKKFPELLRTGKWNIAPEKYESDSSSLIEPEFEFDPDAKADLVLKNALIYDSDSAEPLDIAVADNLIIRIGSAEEVAGLTTADTTVIDARGNSVVPGFVDSHLHLDVAMQRLRSCNVEDVETACEFRERVLEFVKNNPDSPVLYVFGLHYFDSPVIPSNTCRHMLDELILERPLVVYAHDLHTVWGNTKALQDAGVLHSMPPYPHLVEELNLEEKIVVDADGIPTGEFREPEVCYFLTGPLQARFPFSPEQQLEDLKEVCRGLAGMGITGVHRMGLAQPAEDLAFLLLALELEQQGELPIRINSSISCVADDSMLRDVSQAYRAREVLQKARERNLTAAQAHNALLELLKSSGASRHDHIMNLSRDDRAGQRHPQMDRIVEAGKHILESIQGAYVRQHDERMNPHEREGMPDHIGYHAKIRCDTIKIFMDGVVEKNTAYRLDMPPTPGIPEFGQNDLDQVICFADRLGMQVAGHCIGDGSVRSMLDSIARARIENAGVDAERGHRIPHRVEHIEMCRPEDVSRFGELHVITSMQPLHERPPVTLWHELVPRSEWDMAFAWQDSLSGGAVLVFGSDWPIVSCDVCKGINHAVSRRPWYEGAPSQSVDLGQALGAYTSGAAISEYCQGIKGCIRPGMLADLVVFSGNVHELVHSGTMLDVRYTVCDGKVVYIGD